MGYYFFVYLDVKDLQLKSHLEIANNEVSAICKFTAFVSASKLVISKEIFFVFKGEMLDIKL